MNRLLLSYRLRIIAFLLLISGIASHVNAKAAALAITIAKTKGITCAGNTDGIFKATPTGGTAPYTYLWSNGDTGQSTTTGLAPGTYTCTVTDATGTAVTSAGLAIAAPKAIVISASTQTNVTTTGGSDGTATVTTVTGGTPPYTYSWTSTTTSVVPAGNGTNQITGLTAGTWTASVGDHNGCTAAIKTFTITEPAAALGVTIIKSSGITCAGNSDGIFKATVTGGTAPYTYLWSIILEPKLAFRGIKGFDNILDAGINVDMADRFNISTIYHTNQSISFGVGLNLLTTDLLLAYTNNTGPLSAYANNTFEFGVKLKLFR